MESAMPIKLLDVGAARGNHRAQARDSALGPGDRLRGT